jgi:hypothetical protein
MADIHVTNHGTLLLLHTENPAVHEWFEEHTDAVRLCNAYAIGWRYAQRILELLQEDGFSVA